MGAQMEVLRAGLLTTLQDAGRYGYQKMGIPVSGAMDQDAYRIAGFLLGNRNHEAVLEMTLLGGSFRFTEDVVCAVTGADMQPMLSGRRVERCRAFVVKKGEELSFGAVKNGCRTYLAVAGGFDVPPVLGSRSTCQSCSLGGYNGRALKAGDRIPVGEKSGEIPINAETVFFSRYMSEITVRVIPGPQEYAFTEKGILDFYGETYTVSTQSDRMGCRLEGKAVESIYGTDIISDGTVFGSIQITGSGVPIVLMADRQTTGGYAKIATVVSEDLPLLAQAAPGVRVRFQKIL